MDDIYQEAKFKINTCIFMYQKENKKLPDIAILNKEGRDYLTLTKCISSVTNKDLLVYDETDSIPIYKLEEFPEKEKSKLEQLSQSQGTNISLILARRKLFGGLKSLEAFNISTDSNSLAQAF